MTNSAQRLVTVYITNHNYAQYIAQAIESVLDQTLRDFELIIIDDGSTDGSRAIIEGFADRPNVIAIYQQNKGLNISNNIALRAAHGKYIMRLDADDYLDSHALQVMANVLERSPDVGMVFPDYYHVDENGNVLEVVRRHDFDDVHLLDQPAHGACTMVRRQCLLELDGYDESFQRQDGWDLWIRFIQHYNVRNVNLPLFYYRQHGASLTRNEAALLDTRSRIIERHARKNGRRLRAIAVVPVRGPAYDPNSVALESLGGQKVIDWTLEAACGAERIAGVVVTSPDEDILAHVRMCYGDRVVALQRDRQLANINTHIEDTVFNALNMAEIRYGRPGAVATLYVECPFRTARHIDTALDVMELFDTDTVLGVRPETDVFYRHDGGGLTPLRGSIALRLERDDLFRAVGQMYVTRRSYLEERRTITGGRMGHIVLDSQAALYLRSDWDIEVARLYAARLPDAPVQTQERA